MHLLCTRAVSPLLAKDAAGTPEVPAPVVNEGGRAMLPHNLIAGIGKETGTATDRYRDGDRGKGEGRGRNSESRKESERQRRKKREREKERYRTKTETVTDKERKGRERMKKTKQERQRRESAVPYTHPIYAAFLDPRVGFSVSLFLSF